MEKRYGWICSKCGKCLSPDTKACGCYKEEKKEKKIVNTIEEIPAKEDIYKWIKDWSDPYPNRPVFRFYSTSDTNDPCYMCSSKGSPFCHCTLGSNKVTY